MAERQQKLPRHVAIIMDGNGRWAQKRGLPRNEGHRAGAESAQAVVKCCLKRKIPVLTVYAFSTENWRRPRSEVRFLMSNLRRYLKDNREDFVENDVRFQAIGALDELPAAVRRELQATVEATRDCKSLTVVAALNYGARREMAEAARAIATEVKEGRLAPEQVDEGVFGEHLYTAGLPEPDLLIRTGGEMRLSNFLLWQLSYAELYVTEALWPDFGEEEFEKALQEFAHRERRFGGLRADEKRARRGKKKTGAGR